MDRDKRKTIYNAMDAFLDWSGGVLSSVPPHDIAPTHEQAMLIAQGHTCCCAAPTLLGSTLWNCGKSVVQLLLDGGYNFEANSMETAILGMTQCESLPGLLGDHVGAVHSPSQAASELVEAVFDVFVEILDCGESPPDGPAMSLLAERLKKWLPHYPGRSSKRGISRVMSSLPQYRGTPG
jgi:hypothetical protein